MVRVILLIPFLFFLGKSFAQQKILEIPTAGIPVNSFLYKADPDGLVCFLISGKNGLTGKSKSSLYLTKGDSVIKVFTAFDKYGIWSITSTKNAFLMLVEDPNKNFELFFLDKKTQSISSKQLPVLSAIEGNRLSCIAENGHFYFIHFVKERRARLFTVSTIDSIGDISVKQFENKITYVDKKLKTISGLAELEVDRQTTMIECSARKKFQKRGNSIYLFLEGFEYNLGESYDLTEVFRMNLNSGKSTFYTIPDEKE